MVPAKQAMGMILGSRRVGAAEGHALGFVTEVVPDAELDAAIARWCADILRASPVSIRASKELVAAGLAEADIAAAMRMQPGHPAFQAWAASGDAREGPLAFAEKRAPRWTGVK
jgi:enoyl-CoA hydratase/carnithine racemase